MIKVINQAMQLLERANIAYTVYSTPLNDGYRNYLVVDDKALGHWQSNKANGIAINIQFGISMAHVVYDSVYYGNPTINKLSNWVNNYAPRTPTQLKLNKYYNPSSVTSTKDLTNAVTVKYRNLEAVTSLSIALELGLDHKTIMYMVDTLIERDITILNGTYVDYTDEYTRYYTLDYQALTKVLTMLEYTGNKWASYGFTHLRNLDSDILRPLYNWADPVVGHQNRGDQVMRTVCVLINLHMGLSPIYPYNMLQWSTIEALDKYNQLITNAISVPVTTFTDTVVASLKGVYTRKEIENIVKGWSC